MHLLLAQSSAFSHLSDRFRAGNSQFGWQAVSIVVSVVLIVAVAGWLAARLLGQRERQVLNSPGRLLAELAKAHQLNRRQRHLLAQLARQHDLKQPGMLFVEPALWDVEKLGAGWERHRAELGALRDQLFAAA